MEILKVFTAFSGYDSQCMALDRLGLDYELVGWSEIDKYAIQAHNAVYPDWKDRSFGDISKIDWKNVPDFDLFTYSFPCTDISSAGQQKGLEEGSGTRSSLLWECRKAIEIKNPKYLLLENVKALTQKKFLPHLRKWMAYLENSGYSNFAKVLNAKDYGVPQNRERLFLVSIYGNEEFYFPKPFELKLRLKDLLEKNVDDKYYLSKKLIQCFQKRTEIAKEHGDGFNFSPTDGNVIAKTITTRAGTRTDDNFIYGNKRVQRLVDSGKINGNKTEFLDAYNQSVSDISGTIRTTIDSLSMWFVTEPVSCAMRGRNPDNPSDRRRGILICQRVEVGGDISNCITTVQKDSLNYEPKRVIASSQKHAYVGSVENTSPCITAACGMGGGQTPMIEYEDYRIRKLTPRECFRLMGVSESDIDKMQNAGISNTQQYKMAGNSIVVDVLYHIFRKLFIDKEQESIQLTLF